MVRERVDADDVLAAFCQADREREPDMKIELGRVENLLPVARRAGKRPKLPASGSSSATAQDNHPRSPNKLQKGQTRSLRSLFSKTTSTFETKTPAPSVPKKPLSAVEIEDELRNLRIFAQLPVNKQQCNPRLQKLCPNLKTGDLEDLIKIFWESAKPAAEESLFSTAFAPNTDVMRLINLQLEYPDLYARLNELRAMDIKDPVKIEHSVRPAVAEMRNKLDDRAIAEELHPPPRVYADDGSGFMGRGTPAKAPVEEDPKFLGIPVPPRSPRRTWANAAPPLPPRSPLRPGATSAVQPGPVRATEPARRMDKTPGAANASNTPPAEAATARAAGPAPRTALPAPWGQKNLMPTAEIERNLKRLLKFSKIPLQDRRQYPNMNRNYPDLQEDELKQLIDIYKRASVDFSDKNRPIVQFGPDINEGEYSKLQSRNVNLCDRLYSLRVMLAANELLGEPASPEEFPAVFENASKPHDLGNMADDALSLASKTPPSSRSGSPSPTDSASSSGDSSPVDQPGSPTGRFGEIDR